MNTYVDTLNGNTLVWLVRTIGDTATVCRIVKGLPDLEHTYNVPIIALVTLAHGFMTLQTR